MVYRKVYGTCSVLLFILLLQLWEKYANGIAWLSGNDDFVAIGS